jgi:F-type H+-transporting ATPase subunit delta
MARNAAAGRYAKALFELAREDGRAAEVRQEHAALADSVEESAELADVLLQPLYPANERKSVLAAVAEQLGSSPVLRQFYSFLIDQRRLVDIAAIRESYDELVDAMTGVARAEIRSASPLEPDQLERLTRALAARVGQDVSVSVEVDPDLLGGVVAKVGNLLLDGSLRSQLNQMRGRLLVD